MKEMMKTVPSVDAKNKLSSLVAAAADEPQFITENGFETEVLISGADYLKLTARNESFVDFLLISPLKDSEIDLSRSKAGTGREAPEFD